MDLSDIYYSLDASSSPELVDFIVQLDDDEIDEEVNFDDQNQDFLDEFGLNNPHCALGVARDILTVGKYLSQGVEHKFCVSELPAKILKGYRDRCELLDALGMEPDPHYTKSAQG